MSNHNNLVFFNKEGDYLNFNYNDSSDRFEGDILFHESSSDVFKTYGVYTLEKVPSFEFELEGSLSTKKFQLFNEYGIHFYGSKYKNQQVNLVEPVNNDPSFYSKWIYGDSFEKKFPIGTIISFDSPFLEFSNIDKSYVVVSTKKGAIMVIGQIDNKTFELNYSSIYNDPSNYEGRKISALNVLGVYNYVDGISYIDNLSTWNEPSFYSNYFEGKKLNVINSEFNNKTLTVKNERVVDLINFEYKLDGSNLPNGSNLIIEVITKTDLPKIYEGSINVGNDSKISINSFNYPEILKPGREFKIVGSSFNDIFFTVDTMSIWEGISNTTYFATQSQVIYQNKVYECVLAYTHSFADQSTAYINPEDETYWTKNPTYVSVTQQTNAESISNGQLYLTSDRYYFQSEWDTSSEITLASTAERYKEDISIFNIDIYYSDDDNILKSDLVYPSDYAEVNYYYDNLGASYSIGEKMRIMENLVEVEEELVTELNYDISERYIDNIVFTDLDEYGFKISINKMIYEEEIAWVYSGISIDMPRTIDKTLRNWLSRNYIRLYTLGINAELKYVGSSNSLFYNSIQFSTEYPNVPFRIEEILVGSTADFYIQHSSVLFTEIGPYLNININGVDYGVESDYNIGTNITNITSTLNKWVELHKDTLATFEILVSNINGLLNFNFRDYDRRLDYTISTNLADLPGLDGYEITRKKKGNHGVLISSNEVVLPGLGRSPQTQPGLTLSNTDENFNSIGFSTGMLFSINNTMWPWVNQEFNVQYVDEGCLNLSYEGPFWGLTDSICNSSAFITIAFSNGFSATGCSSNIPEGLVGEFDGKAFSSAFSIQYNPNYYTPNVYDLNTYAGSTNLVDIEYIQLSNSLYALGDGIIVMDAFTSQYIETINLPGLSQSLKSEFNVFNNYLYCLSNTNIYVIDPLTNTVVNTITLSNDGYDMVINDSNGDVYVTYNNTNELDIWSYNNFSSPSKTIDTSSNNYPSGINRLGKMVYDSYNSHVCVVSDSDYLLRINSIRNIERVHQVSNLIHNFVFYEQLNNTLYVYNGTDIVRIEEFDNNDVDYDYISISGQPFDMIYNNLTNDLKLSTTSGFYYSIDINDNSLVSRNLMNYGNLSINQYDGDVYLSTQNSTVIIINSNTDRFLHSESVSNNITKLVYNPQRESIWGIQPSSNSIIEIEVQLNSVIVPDVNNNILVGDNLYGTLDPDYEERDGIWLKSREYIRTPRENFRDDVQVDYYWRWQTDDSPEFFMYDFSGDQLPTSGSYSYTGEKPLPDVVLNRKPNRNINSVNIPQYQQTIFDKIQYTLPYLDSVNNNSVLVNPLQLFIGFKSEKEGAFKSTLQLFKKEEIRFEIDSDINTNITLEMVEPVEGNLFETGDRRGIIKLNEGSSEYFTKRGLKPGQLIVIYLNDITNEEDQYVSDNTASVFRIRNVYSKQIIVDFLTPTDFIVNETTVINDYPRDNDVTYLKFTIKVADREIGRFNVYGQTDEEDERFKIELGNIGKLINPDEVFIFSEYDILEGGIDWKIMNRKRKEMLMMKHLIYPYIGAYKSIINAINYFGYNDLQLNEYYRNINNTSVNFGKLFKVEIPDIFDNSVEGWVENDFIKGTYPNENYDITNLFNLTYFITDKEGNNVLNYSLDEIIIKLQGLKYWLKRNIIPLTHKIQDITGVAYVNTGVSILHKMHDVRIFNIHENMTPITFKMNEAYLMPINSGSTVYTCVLDFYTIIPGIGKEDYLVDKPKAFNNVDLNLPDYFNIKVRTYKTYKEWEPFKIYEKGDKVRYYDKLYESVIDGNRTKDPRKYDNVPTWTPNISYQVATIVEYDKDYYVFRGLNEDQSLTPNLDSQNWLKITEWKQIEYKPVQTIHEYRKGDDLTNFSFTVDSNIDPYISIEVLSDNGYGEVYNDRKNYELRGLNDLGDASIYAVDDLPKLTTGLVVIPNDITTTTSTTSTTTTTTLPGDCAILGTAITAYVPDCDFSGTVEIVYKYCDFDLEVELVDGGETTTTSTTTSTTTTTTIPQIETFEKEVSFTYYSENTSQNGHYYTFDLSELTSGTSNNGVSKIRITTLPGRGQLAGQGDEITSVPTEFSASDIIGGSFEMWGDDTDGGGDPGSYQTTFSYVVVDNGGADVALVNMTLNLTDGISNDTTTTTTTQNNGGGGGGGSS